MKNISGVILAGGNSSRMGTDKGVMDLNGKKVVQYVIDALKPVVDDIIIIANNENYSDLGLPVYNDEIKDCGPLGGIYTALQKIKTEKAIILSCDIPFVNSSLLADIISQSEDYDAIVPVHDGKFEPICAVYTKKCIAPFNTALEKKIFKLTDAMSLVNTKEIKLPFTKEIENNFINLNTLQDLNKYKK
jgi:molybdopterin-guanine dinucleotide biosynthesis protein A